MTESADLGLLVVRACLAAVFLYSALDKIAHPADAVAELQAFSLPSALRYPVIAFQLAAGLSVLLGCFTSVGALALAGFTALAPLIAHRFWGGRGPGQRRQSGALSGAAVQPKRFLGRRVAIKVFAQPACRADDMAVP